MNLHNIQVISRYEGKLLRRSWLFRIFALLALVIITILHISMQSTIGGPGAWNMTALSSSIPFFNIYVFNVVQSIIAIFLAGDFLKRDKKLDTAEVTNVRPMSNTDYIAGKTWGIVRVFMGLNIIALLVAAFINIFASDSPFNLGSYLFYLLTLSLPSLVFVLGLSFVVMSWMKNQAITMVVLLGFIGVSLVYLGTAVHGAFDFFAMTLPNIFSEITGHPDLQTYLMQRIAFLLLGLGLLSFTIALMKRLPQRPGKRVMLRVIGLLFILAGAAACLQYIYHFRGEEQRRKEYLSTYKKYVGQEHPDMSRSSITLTQQGEQLRVRARVTLLNNNYREVSSWPLYLNPSLQVEQILQEGKEVAFKRERQVIVIEQKLRPWEEITLDIHYAGRIDESICYLDVPDDEFYDTRTGSGVMRYGKRYAFVGDEFTLLAPECLWYPVACSPINPENPYNLRKNFTLFTLKVVAPGDQVILSQGRSEYRGDTLVFVNDQPLPAISLSKGDYEKKELEIDSLKIELYHFKGHDHFSAEFENMKDTLVPVLRGIRDDYETRKNRDYPFRRLVLAETPISFFSYLRNWKGASDFVLPEIVFLPEKLTTLPGGNFRDSKIREVQWGRGRRDPEPLELEIRVFRDFIYRVFLTENISVEEENIFASMFSSSGFNSSFKLNKYEISPLYFNHVNAFYSSSYPVMDVLLNVMQKQEEVQRGGWWRRFSGMNDAQRAAEYLKSHSFEQAIRENSLEPEVFYELLKLKATYLKNYILSQHSSEKFNQFTKSFAEQYRFRTVDFTTFNSQFIRQFHMNLMDLLPEWYIIDNTPLFIVRGVEADEAIIEDVTRYVTRFQVHNPAATEGIISVRIEERRGRGGGFGGPGGFGRPEEQRPNHYLIPPGSFKEIRILTENAPNTIVLNTNISQNLPSEVMINVPREPGATADTATGIFNATSTLFEYNPKEITVDNEDKGFKLLEANQKRTLQDLLNISDEDPYKNMNFWMPPSRWTATVGSNFYGDYIKSGYYKKVGSGKNAAEWSAQISIPGFYEVSVYNSALGRGGRGRDESDTFQYYTVYHQDGEDVVPVQTNRDTQTWISLGSFYFSEGEAKIVLNDKGASTRQLIFADAVKWVYQEN